ncbi:DEAD/DEAH box helicase family protein [bacterium]|nr:DEAD/DEAH box helicase family protein [bacterium]MBU1152995.1 DEAD/DEAH box helicase family protein [bacterium]
MPEIFTIKASDLILKVSENIDPTIFDISRYEAFLDALCGTREFQKETIRTVLRYLLGGRYRNLRQLAEENYNTNPALREIYPAFADFERHLQLPDKFSCTIDLATGTGKSYVLYGLARIMLAEGMVDRVLVLVPSTTIEKGLTEKFMALSGDADLLRLIPQNVKIRNPEIINATQTIREGDICIENIHAVYEHVKSSVEDSLIGKGEKTLVLCDEVHHAYNPPGRDQAIKKWKEFLQDPRYNFCYIIGDTGTAYIENEYFTDVVYRYSLREAIEERTIKTIRYVAEDSPSGENEKFQKIYDNHLENKMRYRQIKPITIIVTKDISVCKKLTAGWIDFIAEKERLSKEEAEKKVLIVTSSPEHKENIFLLDRVDDKNDPTEWITSVSMLTEGWDVKNVFQIVPHEERAFNSKLLIAQVLGRGLRIPAEYKGEQPVVTVFNHDNWARNIKHLVEEVMEIEKRLHTYPVTKEKDYNFEIHQIRYEKMEQEFEAPQIEPYKLLEKGYITYSTQIKAVEKETVYERAITGVRDPKATFITYKMYPIDIVVQEIWNRLKVFDIEEGSRYANEFSQQKIKEIIKNSLDKRGWSEDTVTEENYIKTLQTFGVIKRKRSKTIRFEPEVKELEILNTSQMQKTSLGIGAFKRKDSTVFYDDDSLGLSENEDVMILNELKEDEELPRRAIREIRNKFLFNTPLNVAFAHSAPERKFIEKLTSESNARLIDAWIKSRDTGFYSIDYSWEKGTHTKHSKFNPDFFLKIGTRMIIVEIKDDELIHKIREDGDMAKEIKAKYKYAIEHLNRLNKLQTEQTYYLTFLTPMDFDNFFSVLRKGDFSGFKSQLDAELEE